MEHSLIFKNTIFQTFARTATTIAGFIVTILIARYFGADGYGDYTKIISVVSIFYLIIDFGLNAAYVRDRKYSFSHLLYSRIGIAFLLFIALNIAVYFLPFNNLSGIGFSSYVKYGILIFSLSFFNQAIILSASAVFQKNQKYQLLTLSQAIGSILTVVLVFAFLKISFSLMFIISSLVFAGIGSSLASLLLIKEDLKFSAKVPKELFFASLPLAAMLVFNLIYFKIDAVILSFYKSSGEVGIYGLSYRFFEFLIALPLFLSNSLYPELIKKVDKKSEFLTLIKKYRNIFLLFSLVFLFASWGLSPLLSLINKDFTSAIVPFRILALSLPFFFVTNLYQWALITIKEQKFLMYVYFLNALINIALNLLLIPRFSYLASATITGLCEALVALILIWRFSRIFSERRLKT